MEMGNAFINVWIIALLVKMANGLGNTDPVPDNGSRFKLSVGPEEAQNSNQKLHQMNEDSIDSSVLSSSGEDSAVRHDVTMQYPNSHSSQTSSFRLPREQFKISRPFRVKKEKKVRLGQYASKHISMKNKNWKLWPEYVKSAIDPSDSNIAWSYWETDDEEPDDADDSKHPTTSTTTTTTTPSTTTTTTTTPAPMMTMKEQTPPVSIHKHFHYFKKAAPWAGDAWMKGDKETTTAPPTPPMTMEDMMKMTDDMMEEIMMKGMMMMPPHPEPDTSKGSGLSGIFKKLSKVEPITILVAGIIPASLILAAALPSVMSKMMAMKGDTNASPMVPMITTTAVSSDPMEMMGSRSVNGPHSMTEILEAVGDFGLKALEKPHCARKMFCKLANEKLMTDSPIMKRAVYLASVAMEDSWLQHVGVQSIFKSLNDGSCNQVDCESFPKNEDSFTT